MAAKPRRAGGFYDTPEWRQTRRAALIRAHFTCQQCGKNVSRKGQSRVDHIQPLATHPELRLTDANLRVLCAECDNRRHNDKWRGSGRDLHPKGTCDANGFPLDPSHHWAGFLEKLRNRHGLEKVDL